MFCQPSKAVKFVWFEYMLSLYFRLIIFVNLMLFCFNANSNHFFKILLNSPLFKILYIAGKTSEGAIYGAADFSFYGMFAQLVVERTEFSINLPCSQCDNPGN